MISQVEMLESGVEEYVCCAKSLHLRPILCDPMDCRLLGSSVLGILQARMLEWAAISFPRGSSQLRDQTWVSCIAGRFFTVYAIREALHEVYASCLI